MCEMRGRKGENMALKKSIKWGVNGHHYGYAAYNKNNQDEALRLAAELGSTIYRINYKPTNAEQVAYIRDVMQKCHNYGMEVVLVLDYGMSENYLENAEDFAANVTYIAENVKDLADYIQLFNETDIWASGCVGGYYDLSDPTGMSPGYFNPERVKLAVELMKIAMPALRRGAPDAKVIVNFGVRHYPMMDYFREAGIEWDILGIDNYEIWDYHGFFQFLEKHFPGYDLMITECNYPALWGPYDDPDQKESEWLEMFLNAMNDYPSDRLKGVMVYELLDQPAFEIQKGSYEGESHFSLVRVKPDNTIAEPKPAYYTVQKLF